DPAAWDDDTGEEAAPPGRGNFLAKVGGRPGIPFHVALTEVEEDLNDTNTRWHTQSRLADVDELAAEPAPCARPRGGPIAPPRTWAAAASWPRSSAAALARALSGWASNSPA